MMLMLHCLAADSESMERGVLQQHLESVALLSTVQTRAYTEGADLNALVNRWFDELRSLQSALPVFNDPGERRRLEQQCSV